MDMLGTLGKEGESPEAQGLEELISKNETTETPNELADPAHVVEANLPSDIREKFEIVSYRNAALILNQTRHREFNEIIDCLRSLRISRDMLLKAGGNESQIPKLFSASLRPLGWKETVVQGDLLIKLFWREPVLLGKKGKPLKNPKTEQRSEEIIRKKFLDGHKIDYVKGRVAFDLEWNSKDQTFDRDLYAFNAFAQCGVIDAGILVTRSRRLDEAFRSMHIMPKYGASTTWMGKLLYRLNAGRNGACPVLAIGITEKAIDGI